MNGLSQFPSLSFLRECPWLEWLSPFPPYLKKISHTYDIRILILAMCGTCGTQTQLWYMHQIEKLINFLVLISIFSTQRKKGVGTKSSVNVDYWLVNSDVFINWKPLRNVEKINQSHIILFSTKINMLMTI